MTRPISRDPPTQPRAIAPHAVFISLQPKTGRVPTTFPRQANTLLTVTSHTRTVLHESELCQERPHTLVAFLPEATRAHM